MGIAGVAVPVSLLDCSVVSIFSIPKQRKQNHQFAERVYSEMICFHISNI